ncbi:hypothetical protein [uncultured Fibrobacter sp.]|uniref:hypothetical protein n=1 Tax=uncultured Fibrobacter sp. TaxID=261512 RepID=UPI0025FA5F18|nr:hypothetical protein [uncultured Fibrobacter sp.]
MKICNLLPFFSLFFFVACGGDSSGVNGVDPETSSSSEELVETSSSFEKGKSSSSVTKKSSSSTAEENKSSSSKAKVSSSSEKETPSSSSAKSNSSSSSADVVLTDPMEIFKPRIPKMAVLHCSLEDERMGGRVEIDFDQQDWICTFKYADKEGFVYVQGSPTSCRMLGMGMNPEISVDTAALYVNGKYETLSAVSYEWGGNHHNDKFRFTYDGKVYEYFHSSYGFGGRSCQEMDCMRVYEADGTTLIEDGCKTFDDNLSEVRSLPVVCRFANLNDGSFGDFTDSFELCNGDFRLDTN